MSRLASSAMSEGFKPLVRGDSSSFRGNRANSMTEASELVGSPRSGSFLREQVLRGPAASLPKQKSPAQLAAARKAGMHYSLKSRIPRDLAATAGEGGQALRRVMLHGATIVFVTPGYAGKRFIYERARELGVRSVILDAPGSWAADLVGDGVIDEFVPVDLGGDSERVLADCIAVIERLGAGGGQMPAGVCTFCELSVPLVARLAEHLGLPGPSSAAVDAARDKHATRAAMAAAGLPSPACRRIEGAADLDAAADAVGFPAVLKPLNGAASLGVKKVETRADLAACYGEVLAEMRETVVTSGALVKRDKGSAIPESSPETSDGDSAVVSFLLEEYLDGPEVDIDVVLGADGTPAYAKVVDNGPTAEPYFAETWGCCPSLLPKADQEALAGLAAGALACCGFDVGVFHVECKLTSRGPRLIEINARMGGGQVRATHLLHAGVDLVEETLFTAIGIPCNPCVTKDVAVAYTYVTAARSGRVEGLEAAAAKAAEQNGVHYVKPLVKDGAAIVGARDALPDWLLDVMATGDAADPRAALDRVLSIATAFDVDALVR